MKLPIVGPTYQSASVIADAQRSVNLYPEAIESGTGKAPAALYGTPGLHAFTTLPAAPVRGLWAGDNRLFAAAGTKLYEVTSGGSATELGTIADDAWHSPVTMRPNGTQLFVVSSGLAYLHNGSTLAACTFDGGGAVTATLGAFLDGYFIAQKPSTKQFFISALNNGLSWDPLDYGVKEGYPDNIISILVDHRELWTFGAETTEVWINTGNADFPLQREPSAFMHQGCGAPWTPANVAGAVCWLGLDARGGPVAWRARGFLPERISTHAVENVWRGYSTISDAIAYSYVENGHSFWVVTFPTADATWCWDATTGMWHERAYWSGAALSRHRGRCHAYVFGKHFVGDHATGQIWQMSSSFYDDGGSDIKRIRALPHVADEAERMFHHAFTIDIEAGVSASGSQLAYLDWSNDGGKTFGAARGCGIGASGAYGTRVVWRRLGCARDRVYRVTITGQSKVAIVAAYLEMTKGIA